MKAADIEVGDIITAFVDIRSKDAAYGIILNKNLVKTVKYPLRKACKLQRHMKNMVTISAFCYIILGGRSSDRPAATLK